MFENETIFNLKIIDLSLSLEKLYYNENTKDEAFDSYQTLLPTFIAPELFTAKKTYSEQCDVWSLGCIIYNMVTGIPPFYESDRSALMTIAQHAKY